MQDFSTNSSFFDVDNDDDGQMGILQAKKDNEAKRTDAHSGRVQPNLRKVVFLIIQVSVRHTLQNAELDYIILILKLCSSKMS